MCPNSGGALIDVLHSTLAPSAPFFASPIPSALSFAALVTKICRDLGNPKCPNFSDFGSLKILKIEKLAFFPGHRIIQTLVNGYWLLREAL